MTEPWERPPPLDKGDAAEHTVHLALGRFLSFWEQLENELAILTSFFIADRLDINGIRFYSQAGVFKYRVSALCDAANRHFIRHPNQEVEFDFDQTIRIIRKASNRRNEIAHSVVFPLNQRMVIIDSIRTDILNDGYTATAPLYMMFQEDERYDYTSNILEKFYIEIFNLLASVQSFGGRRFPDAARRVRSMTRMPIEKAV